MSQPAKFGRFEDSVQQPQVDYAQATESSRPDFTKKLLIIGLIIGTIILVVIVFLVITSSGGGIKSEIAPVTTRQAEIVRIIDEHGENVLLVETQNILATTAAVVQSDQNALQEALNGLPGEANNAEATIDSTVDERLTSATQTSNFDDKILDIISDMLSINVSELSLIADSAESDEIISAISQAIENQSALFND